MYLCIWQHLQPVAVEESLFPKNPRESEQSRQQTGKYWIARRIEQTAENGHVRMQSQW